MWRYIVYLVMVALCCLSVFLCYRAGIDFWIAFHVILLWITGICTFAAFTYDSDDLEGFRKK